MVRQTSMEPLLRIENLVKQYPGVRAVDGVSFALESGICFGLLGPNGAGKTTTIEVIEGISRPTSGDIFYKGRPRGKTFREEVGIQFQNTELPQYLTVRETLAMFRGLYSRRMNMSELIEICRLGEILTRMNDRISGGQKQRLLLAMAMANDPELIFLDEPTTGLDPQARRHVWNIIRDIRKAGKTLILTTHYMEEAQMLCDTVAIMDNGRIIASGSPADLLKRYYTGVTVRLGSGVDACGLDGLPLTWRSGNDGIEITTDDLNACLQALMQRGIDLSDLTVHSPNLEDLFLMLTGKQLRA